jgi:hypothetical protein
MLKQLLSQEVRQPGHKTDISLPSNIEFKKRSNVLIKVTLKRIRVTVVAVENQYILYIQRVFL